MEAARLTATIDADSKEGEAGIKRFSGLLGDAAGGFMRIIEAAGGFALGGAIAGGISGIVGQIGDMVKSGEDANREMDILAAGLKSTHDASGMTTASLDALSTSLMNQTGIDDDSVKAAEQMLLTFTGIGKQAFPEATQAAADMATRMNGGAIPSAQQMQQQALLLGKALNDPVKGVTALTREGVTFTDQQKKQIAAMEKAGDTAGAQKIILAELNKEFGGSAAAAGQANGGIAILSAQFDNMKQTVGQAVVPILVSLMNALTPITGALAQALPQAISVVQGVFQQWAPVLQDIWLYAKNLGDVFMHAVQPGIDTVSKAFSGLQGPGLTVSGVMNTLNTVFVALAPVVSQVGDSFNKAAQFVAPLLPQLENLVGIFLNFEAANIKTTIQVIGTVLANVGTVVAQLMPDLNQLAAWFVSTGLPAAQQFNNWFQNKLLPILLQLGDFLVTTLVPALGNLGNFIVTTVVPAVEQFATWFGEHVLPILEQVVAIVIADVLPTLESIAKTVLTKLVPALENLWNKISPVLIPALQFLGTILKDVVGPAINLIITIVSDIIDWIANFIGKIGDLLGWLGNLKDHIGEFVGDALGKIGDLKDKFISKLGELKDAAGQKFTDLKNNIMNTLQDLPNKLHDLGTNLIQKLIDGITGMAGNLTNAAKNAIGGALSNIPGVGGLLSHLPGHASGTQFTAGGAFLGAERGPELLLRPGVYSAPRGSTVLSTQDTQRALSGGGGMGGVVNNYNIYPAKAQFGPDELQRLQRRNVLLARRGGA